MAYFLLTLTLANDVTGLRESEEKLKQQQQESARRENILVMRLATKEQEMQECTVSILKVIYFFQNVPGTYMLSQRRVACSYGSHEKRDLKNVILTILEEYILTWTNGS